MQSLGPSGPLKAPRGPLLPQAEPRPPGVACTEAAFLNGPPSAPAAPAPFLPPPAPQAKLWDWPALKTPPRGHTNSHCRSRSSCPERTKEGARVRPGGPEDRGTTPAGACPHSWARRALHRRGRRRAESAVSHGGSRRGRTKCDKHWGDGLETSRGGHRPLSQGCVPGWVSLPVRSPLPWLTLCSLRPSKPGGQSPRDSRSPRPDAGAARARAPPLRLCASPRGPTEGPALLSATVAALPPLAGGRQGAQGEGPFPRPARASACHASMGFLEPVP